MYIAKLVKVKMSNEDKKKKKIPSKRY